MTGNNKLNDEEVIYVRDRRGGNQYPIHNIVMDEWRPLIGPTGLDIYNILSRVSMYREGERARISFSILENFLGHSRSTIWTYLRLLELCHLIFREKSGAEIIQNGKRKRNRTNNPNNYYILPPKPVTNDTLNELKSRISSDKKMDGKFKDYFFDLIEQWKPFSVYFSGNRKSRIKPLVNQPSLFQENQEDGDPPAPSISPIVQRILETVSIREKKIVTELSIYEPSMILAVIWHGRTETWINPERFSGYVIKTLRKGTIPPNGFIRPLA